MITSEAVKKFLRRDRDDWRHYKTLNKNQLDRLMKELPVKPPIWYKLFQHQKACLLIGIRNNKFGYFLDCVAGETRIETNNGPIRIDELERVGLPIKVWSLTKSGLRLVDATCPFKKGYAPLYKVRFASGRTITVTDRHAFLTSRGWICCGDLVSFEHLPLFDVSRPLSISEYSLSGLLPNAEHSNEIAEDFLESYYFYHHPYDEQLLAKIEDGRFVLPFSTYVPIQNHSFEQMGGRNAGQANNHPYLISEFLKYPPSMNHLTLQDYHDPIHMECFQNVCDLELFERYNHNTLPTLEDANYPPQVHEDAACLSSSYDQEVAYAYKKYSGHEFYLRHSACRNDKLQQVPLATNLFEHACEDQALKPCVAPYFASNIDSVIDIQYIRTDVYYDLHVPIHENYIAHGICNHNTGCGKTLLSLATICYRRKLGELRSCLILVPNRTNKTEWRKEIEKHTSLDYCILKGSTADKWAQIEATTAPVIVETYGGLAHLCCTKVANKRRKGKQKLKPSLSLVKKLMKKVNALVLDESTLIKSKHSLAWRICRKIGKDACMLIELTGTPFGRDPTDLWGQIQLLDDGHTLGETLGLYRATFFSEKLNYWGGKEYTFKQSMTETLHKFIGHCTINFEADEADLPSVMEDVKRVGMPAETQHYIDEQLEILRRAQKGKDVGQIKNSFVRLRQMSSGWMGFKDDNGKAEIIFPKNPKLDLLAAYTERIASKDKFIIFHDFNVSGRLISERLSDIGIPHAWLWGGTKDPDKERAKFDKDSCQALILSAAFGYGLNLQQAKYGLFFESPVPVIMRKQCVARYIRQGSEAKHKFLTDFVMAGTFDQAILKWHRQGGDLFQAIVKGEYGV